MKKPTLALLGLAICTSLGAYAENRFQNPSFEKGRDPWISLAAPDKPYWHDFSVATDPKNVANHCARLTLSAADSREKTEVWGVLQEVSEAGKIPRYLRGRYFVEDWQRGTAKQYIQVVLNVWLTGNDFGKRGEHTPQPIPLQTAFVLCGIAEVPFQIANRKFVFAGPTEPKLGEWIEFEFDLPAAIQKEWGRLPKDFRGFRVLFETRFDDRVTTEHAARATVYFDDLYLGDESRAQPGTAPSESQKTPAAQ